MVCVGSSLTASLLSMEEDLLNALLVLSIFPSSFVEDTAICVLGDELSAVRVKSMLRKLCNRGILEYNSSTARYDFHILVRDTARALASILGEKLIYGIHGAKPKSTTTPLC